MDPAASNDPPASPEIQVDRPESSGTGNLQENIGAGAGITGAFSKIGAGLTTAFDGLGTCVSNGLNRLLIWENTFVGVALESNDAPTALDPQYKRRLYMLLSSITAPTVCAAVLVARDIDTIRGHPLVIAPMVLPILTTLLLAGILHGIRRSLLVSHVSIVIGIIAFLKAIGFGVLLQIADPTAVAAFAMSCCYVLWALQMEFSIGIPTQLAILTTSGSVACSFVLPLTTAKKNRYYWFMILIPVCVTVLGTLLIWRLSSWAFPSQTPPPSDPSLAVRMATHALRSAERANTSAAAASQAANLSKEGADAVVTIWDGNDPTHPSMLKLAQDVLNSTEELRKRVTEVKEAAENHKKVANDAKNAAATAVEDASTAAKDQEIAAATAATEDQARRGLAAVVPRLQGST